MELQDKPAPFEMSLDVSLLVKLLSSKQAGEVATYEELSAAIGRDVRERRSAMHSALRHIQNTDHAVFACVPNVGYKRLSDKEIVDTGTSYIQKSRRVAKRGAKSLACVKFDNLTPEQRLQHNAKMTVLAMVQESTSHHAVKRIESAVAGAQSAIAPARAALAAFSSLN